MSSPAESLDSRTSSQTMGGIDRFLRAQLHARLSRLRGGQILIQDPDGNTLLGDASAPQALRVSLRVHHPDFYRQVASHGSVGAGEAYIDRAWDSDDLVGLVRLLVRNRDLLDGVESGMARIGGVAMKAWHSLQRNTRSGSRRNISAHYDLGNEFFSLFLDSSMMYSSAMFAMGDSLEQASQRKLDRICQKLDLRPGDHLVEIGTGWGGMALHAAQEFDCRVTTTTISREQHALASKRIQDAGLGERVTVLLEDYRDLQGEYDKLVSIEMIEAIGHQYLDTYFAKCASLLRADGIALVQAITIEDDRYQQALRSVDFIKRHVFPGSFIPCVNAMVDAAARAGKLRLVNLEDFGDSYATTLNHWRSRFLSRLDQVRAQGYDERFIRLWEFYLCYCEGGFLERSISDVQLLFARGGNRRDQYLPGL